MTIAFNCPKCGKLLRVQDEAAGKKGKCSCGASLIVPAAGQAIAKPAPSAVAKQRAAELEVASTRKPALKAEVIPRGREIVAPSPPSAPAVVQQQFETAQAHYQSVPAPQIQYVPVPVAMPPQAPPNIVLNVTNQANAVAIADGRRSNLIASVALVMSVCAILFCWIPFVGMLCWPLAILAILLAGLGFFLGLFKGGAGMPACVGAGILSVVAMAISSFSTSAAVVATGAAAAKAAADAHERERIAAKPREAQHVAAKPVPVPASTPEPLPAVPTASTIAPAAAPTDATPAPAVDPEAAARKKYAGILSNARGLIKAGVYPSARRNLQRIIDEAPGTAIAGEAKSELDAMPRH